MTMNLHYFSTAIITTYEELCITFTSFLTQRIQFYRIKNLKKIQISNVYN